MDPVPGSLATALGDRYRLERELGRGGMATVYLAEDRKHHRRVAIKVLSPEVAAAIGADRFLREIEIAARLSHPHVLPLFDSGAQDGLLYYVMPWVEGETLRGRLERERQLPLEDALRLTREIASALGHAHQHGLVHRDIKPENVLLADGIALVADFGIARAIGAGGPGGLTRAGVLIGTPLYMAPEQAVGSSALDGRADLYSLGCVLYEMLAGEPPFTGPTTESLVHQHVSVEPRPVTDRRPGVPGAVAAAIAKALAKVPADRFATAARMAEALSVGLTGSPTPAAPAAESAVANNLPRQRSSFVGRERELAECARLLGETRLLTITGVGGCGKTRLALKLAESLLEGHPDGVWFVDLAPVTDESRLAQAVASALEIREDTDRPLFETLVRRVASRRMLLVLDNCEHLLGGCAALVDALLSAGPDLRLIATSRESLGVDGERPFGLRSLGVPPAGREADLGIVETSEAVRLFLDRARVVAPDFALGPATAPAVAEICRRLDGIPLAIELAAARVELLSADQIRDRLDDRFRLLTGGSRALPRHQTLRATMQWSHDLLAAGERRLVARLSVFAGGWTLEGATAVAGHPAGDFEVLELLTRLVRKSLVVVEREGWGDPRYRMLETVRQYAQERLNESGEGDAARSRHLDFYLALAEEADPHLYASDQGEWLRRLDRERENLLAAHSWCDRDPSSAEKGLRLAGAVRNFWLARGLLEVGLRMAREALDRPGAGPETAARALALYGAGWIAFRQGDYATVRGHLEESLRVSRAVGDRAGVTRAVSGLGAVNLARGETASARGYYREGIDRSRELGDRLALSIALTGLAEVHRAEGNDAAAVPLYEESLAISRELGHGAGTASDLLNLARVEVSGGRHEQGRRRLLEAMRLADEIGDHVMGCFALDVAAGLAAARGDAARTARLFGVSERVQGEMNIRRDPVDERFLSPLVARARAGLGDPAFDTARGAGHELSYEAALAEARAWLDEAPDPGSVPARPAG